MTGRISVPIYVAIGAAMLLTIAAAQGNLNAVACPTSYLSNLSVGQGVTCGPVSVSISNGISTGTYSVQFAYKGMPASAVVLAQGPSSGTITAVAFLQGQGGQSANSAACQMSRLANMAVGQSVPCGHMSLSLQNGTQPGTLAISLANNGVPVTEVLVYTTGR